MESISKLKEILSAMLKVHERLLVLMKEKQVILVEGKVAELHGMIGKETKCAEIIRVLEEQREAAIREFIIENRLAKSSLTMYEVIDIVADPKDKDILSKYTGGLREILQEIRRLNENNQEMIALALSYIQYSINILMPKEPSFIYGNKNQSRSVKFLDTKA